MSDWMALSITFTGWSLNEIKELSYKERSNWLEMARAAGKLVRT
jgi:hypothetical protein